MQIKKLVSLPSRTGRQLQRYNQGFRQVVGCIPYRIRRTNKSSLIPGNIDDLEVLLITSQKSQRVMFPKSSSAEGLIFIPTEYIPWLAWIGRVDGTDRKVEEVARLFDEFLEDVLEEHRHNGRQGGVIDDGDGRDFVDILLEFQKDNKDAVSHVEDDTIKALILDMFAAGTDTTASVLEWAMVELLRNPSTMEKLQNEVRKLSSQITEDDLDKLPYLKAVIKECIRLHSPIPLLVPREAAQDTKVMGYDIAAGTRVVINAWAIGRDPSIWENPEEFHPDRFLGSTVDFRGLHFELIPFGAGRRGCPGTAFAVTVIELTLAKLVQKFDFSLPHGMEAKDMDMSETVGLTAHRKLPLIVTVTALG